MGWWSEFTGKAGAKRATQAAIDGNKILGTGYEQAYGTLDTSRLAQLAALNSGYDQAGQSLTDAERTAASFLNQGADKASGAINTNYDKAAGNIQDYYTRTENLLNPFIQRGNKLAGLYDMAMGGQGADSQADFYNNYAAQDPFRSFRDEQANRQIQAQFNARGMGGSGRMDQAVARASLERGSADLDGYLNRLERAGQQGQQSAGQLAGIASNTGNQLAGINTNRGDHLASIESGRGNNLATNAMQFGGTRANFDVNRGRDLTSTEGAYGNTKSGLRTQLSQLQSNNLTSGASAANASMKGGMNNLFGIGSALISGFTPGLGGVSAFGNAFNTFKGLGK